MISALPAYIKTEAWQGNLLCPGQTRSLHLHLLVLGCDLHGSNPHAPIAAEAGHNSHHLVGIPFCMCVCILILSAHASLCPFLEGGFNTRSPWWLDMKMTGYEKPQDWIGFAPQSAAQLCWSWYYGYRSFCDSRESTELLEQEFPGTWSQRFPSPVHIYVLSEFICILILIAILAALFIPSTGIVYSCPFLPCGRFRVPR